MGEIFKSQTILKSLIFSNLYQLCLPLETQITCEIGLNLITKPTSGKVYN